MEVSGFWGQGRRLGRSKGKSCERVCQPGLWVQAVAAWPWTRGMQPHLESLMRLRQIRYLEQHALFSSCKPAACMGKHTLDFSNALLVPSLWGILSLLLPTPFCIWSPGGRNDIWFRVMWLSSWCQVSFRWMNYLNSNLGFGFPVPKMSRGECGLTTPHSISVIYF